jgi:hypothetical protein
MFSISVQVLKNKKPMVVEKFVDQWEARFFFRLHAARKHPKKFPYYKKYKNSRFFLDEKAKFQPWILKKKPKLDIKIGEIFILHR